MPTIILSYRRDDTGAIAGRIFDRLVGHYGADQVFMDIDSIPFGLDFREHIQETLKRCDVLLAIVGKNWAAADEKGAFRINEENDWVRIEVEAALARKIPVIPVLIDNASLPAPASLPEGLRNLVFRQAAPVDSGRDFNPHMARLIKAMDQLLAKASAPRGTSDAPEKLATEPKTSTVAPDKPRSDKPTLPPKPQAAQGGDGVSGQTNTTDEVIGGGAADHSLKRKRRRKSGGLDGLGSLLISPKGRLSAKPFCALIIATSVFMLVGVFVLALVWEGLTGPLPDLPPISFLAVVVWLWIVAAAGIKRLHDGDRRGEWVILPIGLGASLAVMIASAHQSAGALLPGTGLVVLFALPLGLLKGSPGPNRYGPDPLAPATKPRASEA